MKKLKPKSSTIISLKIILLFCFILAGIRWINTYNFYIVVINQNINSHITNFIFSVLLCVLIGYFLQLFGKKYISNIIVGFIIMLINYLYEIVFPLHYTPDIPDLIYGIVGTFLSLIYLYIISKIGFENKE